MINEIKNKIHTLVQKYEQGKEVYRTSRFNETQVRNEFLDPLFEILGWDIRNIAGKNTNEREVLLEEPLKANAASHTKKPDYTFRLFFESASSSLKRKSHASTLTVKTIYGNEY